MRFTLWLPFAIALVPLAARAQEAPVDGGAGTDASTATDANDDTAPWSPSPEPDGGGMTDSDISLPAGPSPYDVVVVGRKPAHHLSHGQKQRVALAGALVAAPGLLLLDEPSAGLDPPGKIVLARLLAGLDAAMVIATHDVAFAARLCTRFIMLEDGRVAFDGTDTSEVLRGWE